MNKKRRKELGQLWDRVNALKERWTQLQTDATGLVEELESVRGDEQESYDSIPEGLREGERGTESADAISELDTAVEGLGEVAEHDFSFDDWLTAIDTARGTE